MNHYETLGVERNASADDIKRAWRVRSSAAHPDREGGDAAQMAAINSAYEVLGDPVRRKAYDETGADVKPDQIEHEARGMLLQLFSAAIAGDENWVEAVSRLLGVHQVELTRHQADAQAKRERLVKRRHWVRIKQGENLVHGLIDQQVQGIEQQLKAMGRGLEVNKAAREMLGAYEFEGTPPAPQQSVYSQLLGMQQAAGWR